MIQVPASAQLRLRRWQSRHFTKNKSSLRWRIFTTRVARSMQITPAWYAPITCLDHVGSVDVGGHFGDQSIESGSVAAVVDGEGLDDPGERLF
jgi:hypothetical protein